jgi:hypothetical protein
LAKHQQLQPEARREHSASLAGMQGTFTPLFYPQHWLAMRGVLNGDLGPS